MDKLEQRIEEAQAEYNHGARAGWNSGFHGCFMWMLACEKATDEGKPEPPNPENPFEQVKA